MDDERRIAVHLSSDEALVLSHILHRWMDQEQGRAIRNHVEDDAELWALNGLACSLETVAAEVFLPEYEPLLSAARERIRQRYGGSRP